MKPQKVLILSKPENKFNFIPKMTILKPENQNEEEPHELKKRRQTVLNIPNAKLAIQDSGNVSPIIVKKEEFEAIRIRTHKRRTMPSVKIMPTNPVVEDRVHSPISAILVSSSPSEKRQACVRMRTRISTQFSQESLQLNSSPIENKSPKEKYLWKGLKGYIKT